MCSSLSLVQFFVTPWTVVCYSLDFPGENNLVGSHFFLPGSSPKDGTRIFVSAALAGGFFSSEPPGQPITTHRPPRYRPVGKKEERRKALVLGIPHWQGKAEAQPKSVSTVQEKDKLCCPQFSLAPAAQAHGERCCLFLSLSSATHGVCLILMQAPHCNGSVAAHSSWLS